MKNIPPYLIVSLLILFSSCTKRTLLKQYIHDADKVEVMLYSGTVPEVQYITNDVDKIQLWMNYISDSTVTSPGNCKLEGRLVFVQYNDSLPMQFSLTKGCEMVHYTLDGKTYVQPLTDDGLQYIISLKKVF